MRDTNTSARWMAGSFSLVPTARSASIMKAVLERSGRPFLPYPAPPKAGSSRSFPSPPSHCSFLTNSLAALTSASSFPPLLQAASATMASDVS